MIIINDEVVEVNVKCESKGGSVLEEAYVQIYITSQTPEVGRSLHQSADRSNSASSQICRKFLARNSYHKSQETQATMIPHLCVCVCLCVFRSNDVMM
jgi:hypothetical protein